jgi:hypothetical protein
MSSPEPGVAREEIVLPDGRLLWFYTFDDDDERRGDADVAGETA